MIYCDGERDLFDEREFKHLEDGTLAHPYIHEQYPSDKRRPPHYADGGSPVNLQDISVLVSMTNATPSTVTPPSTSCCSPFAWSTQWPELPVVENNDPLLELKKIRYQAQVQAVAAQQAAIIDRDKAARANDYSLHQALYSAYLDLAKGQLDRSLTRAQFIVTAASAIATAYSGVLALSFAISKDVGAGVHPLPVRGIATTIFLGLSIVFAAAYLAYITRSASPTNRIPPLSALPTQRLSEDRDTFIRLTSHAVLLRAHWLQAAVISLGIGILFLPVAFLDVKVLDDYLWLAVVLGVLITVLPLIFKFVSRTAESALSVVSIVAIMSTLMSSLITRRSRD